MNKYDNVVRYNLNNAFTHHKVRNKFTLMFWEVLSILIGVVFLSALFLVPLALAVVIA